MEHASRPPQIIGSFLELCANGTKTTPDISLLVQANCVPIICSTCFDRFEVGEGITLMNCLHEFCQKCIVECIHKTIEFGQVPCPFNNEYKCESFLSEREIRGLVTAEEYNQFIEYSQKVALTVPDTMINIKEPPSKAFKLDLEKGLVELEKIELDCPRCSRMFFNENGIILRNCNHPICKECIIDHFFKNEKHEMKCEFRNNDQSVCGSGIYESEIRFVLSEFGLAEPLDENLARNEISFWCGICSLDCPIGKGVKLKKCSHHICEPCLRDAIKVNSERYQQPEIRCPYSKSFENCTSFLMDCEIESLTSKDEFKQFKQIAIKKATEPNEFQLLTMMDELSYIKTSTEFDCPICFVPCNAFEGIKLRDCLHQFCLECFTNTVVHSEDAMIKCPFTDENLSHCESFFQEREIRAIVSIDVYNKFLERKLKFDEHNISNTFHCKTVDCPGFGIIEDGDDKMICSICAEQNCLKCKAIHKNQTCEDYHYSLTGKVTERYINDLKNLGDVMNCPKCEALINKIAGCSWLLCTFCKTEICWATKGPRWGPRGKGDTSGGCGCLTNGKRCHPQCGNCH